MERLDKLQTLYSVEWSALSVLGVKVEEIEAVEKVSLNIGGADVPTLRITLRPPAFPWRVQHLALVDGVPQVVLFLGSFDFERPQIEPPRSPVLRYHEQTQPL